jgi:uncharacterized membrane protein (DUF485 family)
MAHGPASEWKKEKSAKFKTRLGLYMFAGYTILYFIFIFICVFSPKTMGLDVGKLNLAIVYGFCLIVFAIIAAVIYNNIISKREKADEESEKNPGGKA